MPTISGPGIQWTFEEDLFLGSQEKYIHFDFDKEVLLNGMVVSSTERNYVKEFRIRANEDSNQPNLLSGDIRIIPENVVNVFYLFISWEPHSLT